MPSISDFTWLNQQQQNAFDIDGYIQYNGGFAGSFEINCLLQNIPNIPFTATARIHSLTAIQDGYQKDRYGLVLRQSGGLVSSGEGRLISFNLALDGYHDGYQTPALKITKHINEFSIPGVDYISIYNDAYSNIEWFKIIDDGTDLHFSASTDGITYFDVFEIDRKDFLLMGENQIGFGGIGSLSVNNTAKFWLIDWLVV